MVQSPWCGAAPRVHGEVTLIKFSEKDESRRKYYQK